MTDQSNETERAYERGERAVARSIITHLRPYLSGAENSELSKDAMLHDTRVALNSLARDMGCDDYPTDLHPADIVEKYIGRRIRNMFIRNWNSVETMPPRDGTMFLVTHEDNPTKVIHVAHWEIGDWRIAGSVYTITFTHWMPLPDPPEKDPQ